MAPIYGAMRTDKGKTQARQQAACPQARRAIIVAIGILFLIVVPGCALQRHDYVQKQKSQNEKTAIVIRPLPGSETVEIPARGQLAEAGRGAAIGSELGAAGVVCGGIGFIVCTPVFATVGALGGAAYGAAKAQPRTVWWEAEDAFHAVLAEAEIDQALAKRIESYAQAHNYDLTARTGVIEPETKDASLCRALAAEGFGNALVISGTSVILEPAEFPVINPQRRLVLLTHVQLIRTGDQRVLIDRVVADDLGPIRSVEGWKANHAQAFSEATALALERLGENIAIELFMQHHFTEQIINLGMYDAHVKGLKPLYPPLTANSPKPEQSPKCDSLQPTMSWEPFAADHVTYDLRIWSSTARKIDVLVYSRERLLEPRHTLEVPLEPSSFYFWSVRAHYLQDGRERVTGWSRFSVKSAPLFNVISLGLGLLLPERVSDTFYRFETPPTPSINLDPAAQSG